jgi:tRNA G18 (ribose-2'-O)-methylase SpoU
MRFPAPGETAIHACPRCGADLRQTDAAFSSQRVEPDTVSASGPEVEIVLDNLRSAFNVGSILRTADGAGVRRAYLCGITPTPENPKVAKTALSAEFVTPWEYASNAVDLVQHLKAQRLAVWALEGGAEAISILDAPAEPPAALALIAGNELAGVDPQVLALCDRVVSLPMLGFKRSLNVAVAFGIAMYLLRFASPTKTVRAQRFS